MDLATIIGYVLGVVVVMVLIVMDGSPRNFVDKHAFIVIFGGCAAATMIRFPFSVIAHGFPMGFKYVFTMSERRVDNICVDCFVR